MSKNIIVTGGCGFIGHHFVEHVLKNTNWNIVIIDKLNYASLGFERLRDMGVYDNEEYKNRTKVLTYDLQYPLTVGMIKEVCCDSINYIVHMAAETHVDNSIANPVEFIHNNVMSTVHILELARLCKNLEILFYFSTDEVYGPALGDKLFSEDERHNPTNPYSASKSSAEQICVSYGNTYNVPIMRVNVMNAFGERQHVEKFLPKTINKILNNETVLIHSYPDKKTSGTRFYIHARNIAQGVLFLIKNGKIGESYNLTGEREVSNLELAQLIAKAMNMELKYEMVDFHSSRPGHDLRYGLDGKKMENMGWTLPIGFEEALIKTVKWTMINRKWLEEI
jgi:dTDP-glucose 4,6-dehydratase